MGNSTRRFAALDAYVKERMALLLSKRHRRRGRGYGLKLYISSGNRQQPRIGTAEGNITYRRTAQAVR
jgi:hypothetical protein